MGLGEHAPLAEETRQEKDTSFNSLWESEVI